MINITVLKETIRRERPKRHEIPYTVFDVAKSENNTFAMPSGDSAASATWCVLIGYSLQMPYLYLIVPFVMFARVYN